MSSTDNDSKWIEGNKLINGFMGYATDKEDRFYLYDLAYHDKWNLLMSVVEKISKWYDDESDNYMDSMEEANLLLFRLSIFAGIKETYQAVIQFIQWYNNQNKNNNG